MAKKYVVELTDEERQQLLTLLKKGKVAARTVCRAQMLLQADAGTSDVGIAAALHVGVATVERTRKRFVEEGLDAALTDGAGPEGSQNYRGMRKRFSLPPPVVLPRVGGSGGHCSCWPIAWSQLGS